MISAAHTHARMHACTHAMPRSLNAPPSSLISPGRISEGRQAGRLLCIMSLCCMGRKRVSLWQGGVTVHVKGHLRGFFLLRPHLSLLICLWGSGMDAGRGFPFPTNKSLSLSCVLCSVHSLQCPIRPRGRLLVGLGSSNEIPCGRGEKRETLPLPFGGSS